MYMAAGPVKSLIQELTKAMPMAEAPEAVGHGNSI